MPPLPHTLRVLEAGDATAYNDFFRQGALAHPTPCASPPVTSRPRPSRPLKAPRARPSSRKTRAEVGLYESVGFRTFGREEDAFRDSAPRAELSMSLKL